MLYYRWVVHRLNVCVFKGIQFEVGCVEKGVGRVGTVELLLFISSHGRRPAHGTARTNQPETLVS